MTEQVNQSETFDQLLKKATRLKEFALKNGYSVDQTTIKELNALRQARASVDNNVPTDSWDKLDTAIASLTSVTFPTTIDTLSEEDYPPTYLRFKAWLFGIGVVALFFAVSGFVLSVKHVALQFSNSLLALCLGLLGAVVYGLFNVLRVLPPQAFNPKDEYSNYARLLLGVLVGWVFYFAFARAAFADLPTYLDKTGDVKKDW